MTTFPPAPPLALADALYSDDGPDGPVDVPRQETSAYNLHGPRWARTLKQEHEEPAGYGGPQDGVLVWSAPVHTKGLAEAQLIDERPFRVDLQREDRVRSGFTSVGDWVALVEPGPVTVAVDVFEGPTLELFLGDAEKLAQLLILAVTHARQALGVADPDGQQEPTV